MKDAVINGLWGLLMVAALLALSTIIDVVRLFAAWADMKRRELDARYNCGKVPAGRRIPDAGD
jgi:NADH:ubiquinone oxidoreductase subunit 3 (subunit A)